MILNKLFSNEERQNLPGGITVIRRPNNPDCVTVVGNNLHSWLRYWLLENDIPLHYITQLAVIQNSGDSVNIMERSK